MTSEIGIIMDITAVAVVFLSTMSGARRGFVLTVTSFAQWFCCVVAGFLLCTSVRTFLTDSTRLPDLLHDSVLAQIHTSIEESSVYLALPDLFNGWIGKGQDTISEITAQAVSSALLTVLSFFAVVLGIRLCCFAASLLFSKKHHGGATGFIDGTLGLLFGLARGLILVLLVFALLVPVLGILIPTLAEPVTDTLRTSRIASFLYNQNVLLILIRDLFV